MIVIKIINNKIEKCTCNLLDNFKSVGKMKRRKEMSESYSQAFMCNI